VKAYLDAAQGFLGLCMAQDTWNELERVAPKRENAAW
jgi:hypothetical protein